MLWVLVTVLLLTFLWMYVIRPLQYWKEQGIKQPSLKQLAITNWRTFTRSQNIVDFLKETYNLYPNTRYFGIYQFFTPILLVNDPELIKQVTVKDFDHFVDHQRLLPDTTDPIWSQNLVSLKGQKWRDMRATLSPSFTSSKMKSMFVLISECAERFTNYFVEDYKDVKKLEVKDAFSRCANDVIASCAFGISCDSMKNKDNEFYLMGRKVTSFRGFWMTFKFIALTLFPKLMESLGMRLFSRRATRFFSNIVLENIKMREKEGIVRPDMIHLLMEAKKGKLKYDEEAEKQTETGFATVEESHIGKSALKIEMTDELLIAQALIFFFAGFETVSTAMSFMAYELTINPDVQQKLYEEIKSTKEETSGKLTYDALSKMKYLDMVVSETLCH